MSKKKLTLADLEKRLAKLEVSVKKGLLATTYEMVPVTVSRRGGTLLDAERNTLRRDIDRYLYACQEQFCNRTRYIVLLERAARVLSRS